MYKLVLLRHGESLWNVKNKFTGWIDVDLSDKGIIEAKNAGNLLKSEGYEFDIAYTSFLKRAQETLKLCFSKISQSKNIAMKKEWRLNERHYGSLQGLNKIDTAKKFGNEQVLLWRRSYDIPPPKLPIKDVSHPVNNSKYKNIDNSLLPSSESLKDVEQRINPLWLKKISKKIKLGERVIIVAHGNSLRALAKKLSKISSKDIVNYNIPTGVPLIFELDRNLNAKKTFFLGDQDEIEKKIKNVKNQIINKELSK